MLDNEKRMTESEFRDLHGEMALRLFVGIPMFAVNRQHPDCQEMHERIETALKSVGRSCGLKKLLAAPGLTKEERDALFCIFKVIADWSAEGNHPNFYFG